MTESIYKSYTPEQYEELFSNFLVNSWSFSKLSTFCRNEKAFEMTYLFGLYGKKSSTTIAGEAYHVALQLYFNKKKEGETLTLVDLETAAFATIDEVPANIWKLQKTTPTIEECKAKATTTVSALLKNFITEISVYEEDIEEILAVELKTYEFLTINGVDIPLPCNAVMDLIIRTKAGKVAIIDHKSKMAYMGDDEAALSVGNQAITYVKSYESKTGTTVDEVWLVENKYSQNKDKSPQLRCFKIPIDNDTRRLYEALLYEPLSKMISAVSDPDYIYLINENDNFVDKAEIYDFWARTMIGEVQDFNIEEDKKELIAKRLKKIKDSSLKIVTPTVIKNFKENASKFIQYDLSSTDMTAEEKIEHVLRTFGTIVKVAHKFDGYSSDTYLLEASAGVKISSIYSRRLDIANGLDVANVRLSQQLVVHDGRSYLSVEVVKKRERDLFWDSAELKGKKIPIGKDNFENTIFWDLENHSTPHVLICGATGSGKSVCVKSIIEYAKLAGVNRVVIFDPKYEFDDLKSSAEVWNDIEDIEYQMHSLVEYMNELVRTGRKEYTLVIFDEFADAVAAARKQRQLNDGEKTLEENLKRLLQKGRSSGFRVLAATQRASTKVITGDAKVNLPVQICFRVQKEVDSRVVLDEPGAEALAGRGDGLIKSPEYPNTIRFQSFYKP